MVIVFFIFLAFDISHLANLLLSHGDLNPWMPALNAPIVVRIKIRFSVSIRKHGFHYICNFCKCCMAGSSSTIEAPCSVLLCSFSSGSKMHNITIVFLFRIYHFLNFWIKKLTVIQSYYMFLLFTLLASES